MRRKSWNWRLGKNPANKVTVNLRIEKWDGLARQGIGAAQRFVFTNFRAARLSLGHPRIEPMPRILQKIFMIR